MKKEIKIKVDESVITQEGLQRLVDNILDQHKNVYPEEPTVEHNAISNQVLKLFLDKTGLKSESKVLDIGCGQGLALQEFKEKNYCAVGLTLGDEDYNACKEKGFDVVKADQSFLSFSNNEFDAVWARHVLEHSFFPLHTLTEYKRILKNEGYIYIEVPLPDQMTNQESNPNHYSVFTINSWKELFNKVDLKLIWNDVVILKSTDGLLEEKYASFILQNPGEYVIKQPLLLALSKGENFGWGVCSKYLYKEISSLYEKTYLIDDPKNVNVTDSKILHALTGIDFESITELRGKNNYAYTFFENELINESIENAKKYDIVFGGSTWCKEKMEEKGINNTGLLIQGIDPEKFYPTKPKTDENHFVIFSGGKFEMRKSQDLIIKAVKYMQQKYPDVILANVWYNLWPHTMEMMVKSKHIKFELKGETWKEKMEHLFYINGLDVDRIATYELVPNEKLRELYAQSDIGLFPNRCEGGTNLVLMEYMACGRPVIGSYNSGHKDILNSSNSLRLENMERFAIYNEKKELWADWYDPSLEEIIEKLEFAYHNRQLVRDIGIKSGEDLKAYTWSKSAQQFLDQIL